MRTLILIILTIFSFNLIANESYDEEKGKQDYLNWHSSLIRFINDHKDDNVAMIGLNHSVSSGKILSRNAKTEDRDDFVYSLNQLINNHQLTAQSLQLASNFCKSPYIRDACDIESLSSQLLQKDPDNLFSYFSSFTSAINEKDDGKVEHYLDLMSQSRYAKYPLLPDEKFYSVLKTYIDLNTRSIESIQNELRYMSLSKEDEKYILNSPNTLSYYLSAINFQLIMPIPPFHNLTDTCKSKLDYIQYCKKIARILSNDNSYIIAQLIGYSINTTISKSNEKKHSDAQEKEKLYREIYKKISDEYSKCQKQLNYRQNMGYFPQYLNNLREFGELNALLIYTEVNCKATSENSLD